MKIYSLVVTVSGDESLYIHKSYKELTYENCLEMRNEIIRNEMPECDEEEKEDNIESIEENFLYNFWDNINEINSRPWINELIWSDGSINYYIITSELI